MKYLRIRLNMFTFSRHINELLAVIFVTLIISNYEV